jgi:hypothetical protein
MRNIRPTERTAMPAKTMMTNQVLQRNFTSARRYPNPFTDVEVDVVVAGPGGAHWRVPAFWAGAGTWAFRFAGPRAGHYSYCTECSDAANAGLHGQQGSFRIAAYKGSHPLYRHGRPQVAADQRHFQHADGTPFFWLGDTWWMGLTDRISCRELAGLIANRTQKGFTVIQTVAGLYPDMDWRDKRGANEGGFPYNADFSRINPRWFDYADKKLAMLVEAGLAPCLVGSWGYFFTWMGEEKVKRHWRYLIARYSAYPLFWCLAGEGTMPPYKYLTNVGGAAPDAAKKKELADAQKTGWTGIGRYVRATDPFHNLVSIHPSDSGRNCVEDDSVLDFDMLQTGHGGVECLPNTLKVVRGSYHRQPAKPVVQSEVCYEGIFGRARDDLQRLLFWQCMLNGCAGFTYGANGIWQLNRPEKPYGNSPHGTSWGFTPWQEAALLPGAAAVGMGKRLLEKFAWWKLQPGWAACEKPGAGPGDGAPGWEDPQLAGCGQQLIVAYIYRPKAPWHAPDRYRLEGFAPSASYKVRYIDPQSGREWKLGILAADDQGRCVVPYAPCLIDLVLVCVKTTIKKGK